MTVFSHHVAIDSGHAPPGPETLDRAAIASWSAEITDDTVQVRIDDATQHHADLPASFHDVLVAALTHHLGHSGPHR